jgi:ribosomal protein L37AE/L43A
MSRRLDERYQTKLAVTVFKRFWNFLILALADPSFVCPKCGHRMAEIAVSGFFACDHCDYSEASHHYVTNEIGTVAPVVIPEGLRSSKV